MRKQKGTARPAGGADACLAAPERSLLERVLGSDDLAQTLARVPGGRIHGIADQSPIADMTPRAAHQPAAGPGR